MGVTHSAGAVTQHPVVCLRGHLDAHTVEAAREVLLSGIDSSTGDLVVDVSEVGSVDAAGLGVLAAAHSRLRRADRHLVLRGCPDHLRRVLARTRLPRVIRLEPPDRVAV